MRWRLAIVAVAVALALLLVMAVRESSRSAGTGGRVEPAPPEPPELAAIVPERAPSLARAPPAVARGEVDASGHLPAADLVQAAECSSAHRIRSILRGRGQNYNGPEVAALKALAERSLAANDLPRLRVAIQGLAASGAKSAGERLRRLLGGVDREWAELVEDVLRREIKGERVPLIGEIAREQGWLELLALHGDADDIGWLVARAESGLWKAEDALLKSGHPAAQSWLERRRSREHESRAEKRSRERLRIEEEIRGWSADESGATAWPELQDLFRRYGSHLLVVERSPDGRATASFAVGPKAFLVGLEDIWKRVAAVAAIEAFGAGDLPEFEHLTTAPAEVFESGASSVALRRFALQTVERSKICWSVRTARALERAGETEPTLAEGMRRAATRIRASLE